MQGTLEMTFNQATMLEAVQLYIDQQMTETLKVTKVSANSSGYSDNSFTVLVEKPNDPQSRNANPNR